MRTSGQAPFLNSRYEEASVETAIGVFSSRERAEEAVQELLGKHVPQESIVYLTRSETEAKSVGKQLGATVGGFMGGAVGMSAGVAAATLLLPGIGTIFALGFGAAALLGLGGAGTGAAVGKAMASETGAVQPTPDEKCSEDVKFFREVLGEGRSLVVVRTDPPRPFDWPRKSWTKEEWRSMDTLRFQCKRRSARLGMSSSWISAVELPWVRKHRITRSRS